MGLCGSVLVVWLVGLLDGLFRSWDVLCLEGGDVVVVVAVAVVVAVVGLAAAAVLVVFGGTVLEGRYFLVLLVEGVVEPVTEPLEERKDERSMHCFQIYSVVQKE